MAQVSYGTITITDTTDIESIKNWYLATNSSSGVTKTTSGWTDTIQQMTANNQYLWNYEQILGTGGVEISSTEPTVIGHFGINGTNGTNGADGNSITSIDEYYKITNSPTVTSTNPGSSGWTKNGLVVPTNENRYLWNYQVINYSKTAAEGSYTDARVIGVYGDTGPQGPQGNPGTNGVNTATVYLYQRAISAPNKPSGNLTYTFSSASITSGTLGNWKQSIGELTGTDPIWVIAAVASSNGATDVIASTEWSEQIKLAQNGTNGTNGTNGLNQATVYIYKRATSATAPSVTTYTFSNGSFTVPSGWSKTIPASDGNPCWVTSAIAIGSGATATLTWNTPSILVEDGSDGISPTVTSTSTGVKIVDAAGNETYINNGSDGQSYYTYIRYATDSNGSNMSSSPTEKTYIGVYSGTASPAPTDASSYAPWMKYIGTDGSPGQQGVSVTGVRELYYLKTNNTEPSQITWNASTSQPSQTIYSTEVQNSWTSIVPPYIANAVYYTCIETSLSNNIKSWSAPIENKGLTSANSNAVAANSAVSLLGGHFMWHGAALSQLTSSGARVVERVKEGTTDVSETPSKWLHNVDIGSNGISLRYNEIVMAQLIASQNFNEAALTFYRPATNGSIYVQGKKGMDLTANALTFYKPLAYNSSNEPTAAATLSSTGLNITDGTIQLGTNDSSSTTSGNLTLSNSDFQRSINGTTRSNLRLAIGANFGVKNDGTLYANNAVINGAITVSGNSNVYTKDEADDAFDEIGAASIAEANASYSVEIEVSSIDFVNSNATLVAHPYFKGVKLTSSTTPALNTITSYIWTRADGIAIPSSVTTNAKTLQLPNNSDLQATYVCTISNAG